MKIFVTATGTDIGKTLVTSSIAYNFAKRKINASILKPVISGWNENSNDVYEILKSQSREINQNNINEINLYRFKAALSPDIAASLENKEIDFDKVMEFCSKNSRFTIVEGAGGIMSPIATNYTNLDLINALSASVILVTGNYLGCISHTLTALEVLKYNNVKINKIIVTENIDSETDIDQTTNSINKFTGAKIFKIPRIKETESKYKHVPDILDYDYI